MTFLSRRDFLKYGGLAFVGLAGATTIYLQANDESERLSLEEVTLPIRDLHPALDGFTIAQLSDIHLWPFTQLELVQRAVELMNSLDPDLVVLTGDYVWRDVEAIYDLMPVLEQLNGRYGIFAINGNHEIWTDPTLIGEVFDQSSIPLLVNEGVTLGVGGGLLHLAGLDDGWSGQPDLTAAMANAPQEASTILLLHEPDLADEYARDPRLALQLAGHSHGGQIRFPKVGALVLPHLAHKYDYGLYRVQDMWLYTNRGLGVTNAPVRYNCPPEVTHLTLTRL